MLNQGILEKLRILRLPGVREGLQEQMNQPRYSELSFEERLGLLIDHELALREERRLRRRLQDARFRDKSGIGDIAVGSKHGIERSQLLTLAQCDWLRQHQNVIITGATGVGKSYLGSALGRSACEQGFTVRYYRTKRLLHEVERSLADGSWGKNLDSLARIRLLILDDWFRDPLTPDQVRHLLEIFDDRWQQGSTMLISQVPVENWHACLKDPTLADAILDRLVHNSHRINLRGESQRKLQAGKLLDTYEKTI
jgi:DNA replication protein DnaC